MTENPQPRESAVTPDAEVPAEPDVTAPADVATGPAVDVTKSEQTEERPAAGIETEVEDTPYAAEPALQNVPSTPKETPPATTATPPMAPRRSGLDGGRRFASQGRRENAEEITDPRMRRPAVYEPRTGPSHSRFNPRQPIAPVDMDSINYKNVTVLTRFIDQQGRILSRRKSRVNAKTQRRIKIAIKQARHLALLPYTPTHIQGHRRR